MADRETITLEVGGRIHRGWMDAGIELAIDSLSASAQIGLTATWTEAKRLVTGPLRPGLVCKLALGGETIITGAIDSVAPSYSTSQRAVRVAMRDITADLADSCADPQTFNGLTLPAIAEALCKPFGVPVRVVGWDGGAVFQSYTVDPGERVAETLEDACRQVGALMWTDGLGTLMIGRPTGGPHVGTLELGKHILEADGADDHSQRFRQVQVMGTAAAGESMDEEATPSVQGAATDPEIRAARKLIVVAENKLEGGASAQERADWEARVRRAKAATSNYKLRGQRAPSGAIWRPGQRIDVADGWLGRHGTLMVAGVSFTASTKEVTTRLRLMPEAAFEPIAEGIEAKGGAL